MDSVALKKLMVEVAKRDLGEDDAVKEQSLKLFRKWVETNPDIKMNDAGDDYLIPFLRKGKFSIQKTQELFLKFQMFRNDISTVMYDCDILDPKINLFTKNGYIYASPFTDDNGCAVIVAHYSKFNPSTCDYTDHIRAQVATAQTMVYKEVPSVLGVNYVVDMAGITAAHLAHMPLPVVITYMNGVQKLVPLRFKGFHFINLSGPVKWFFDFLVSVASEKMKKRFMAHSTLEELHKHVNKRALPKEYGGTMPRQEMIDWWYKELLEARETLARWDSVRLVQPKDVDLNSSLAQLPGTFRKLDVD